jgi:hypothetical protein
MGHMNDLSEFVVPVGEHQGTCFIARVECVDEERAELMLATERVSAQRAVSCLIALQAFSGVRRLALWKCLVATRFPSIRRQAFT